MNPVFKPWRYVYFRILMWKLRDPRETTPVLVAGMATSVLLYLNGMLVLMVSNALRGRRLLPAEHLGNIGYAEFALALIATTALINLSWASDGKLARLSDEFSGRESEHRFQQ
jgi:hypothetical protein